MKITTTKQKWATDAELQQLAEEAIENSVSIDDAVKMLKDNNYSVNGKAVYMRKFVAIMHQQLGDSRVKGFFTK